MADFRGYVTAAGQTFEALAKQMGYPVTIGFIEVGDGKLPDSESPIARTQLVHKLKQFPAIVEQDAKNPGQWVATCYIPADDAIDGAGYFIREIGCRLINQGIGVLYAYRRVSDDWKPVITSGEAKSFIYKLRFIPSNGELLTPTIDPSVVLVDKEELERVMKAHKESRYHPHIGVTNAVDIQNENYSVGDSLVCKNYHANDNAIHSRKVSATNDGSGVQTANGLFANLIVEGRIIKASTLGWLPGSDQTIAIAALAPKLKANKVLYINLDSGDVLTTAILPNEYGATMFSGKGKLLCTKLDNMLQRLSVDAEQHKQYHGHINSGTVFSQAFRTAALVKKEVRVVLFGDSISVGPDYDSFSTPAAGFYNKVGVDNADKHDCLANQIYCELVACLPRDTRIKFYSRSIGGLGYGNIGTAWDGMGGGLNGLFAGREQATPGKPWRDCVLDLKPDLVIHSMGMNESPKSYLDDFIKNWINYLDTKQKRHSFDQAILTTPNPNFNDALQYGDFKVYGLNASKFYVSALQRFMALKYGYSLIDSAFNSYLKRYGIDPRHCTFSKETRPAVFNNGTDGMVVNNGSSKLNTECTPRTLPIYHSTTFTVNLAAASNSAGFDFKFNAGAVILQFNSGNVSLFTGIHVGTLGILSVTKPMTLLANTDYTFTLTVTPAGAFLYHNDTLVLVNNDAAYTDTLPMFFENPVASANVSVSNMFVRAGEFARYTPDVLTNGEIYGELSYALNEFGGGINHPSTVGLSEVYLPPVREFITTALNTAAIFNNVIGGTAANHALFIGRILPLDYGQISLFIAGVGVGGQGQRVVIKTRIINGIVSYEVVKNTGEVDVYIDLDDMAVFIKNTVLPLLYVEYTGNWLVNRIYKLGATIPRGSKLAVIP